MKERKIPKIKVVNHGIANVVDGEIELNKILFKNPILLRRVLRHEFRHISGEKYADLKEPFDLGLFFFILAHPSCWTHYLPVWIRDNKIIYNKIRSIQFLLIFIIFLGVLIGSKYPMISLVFAILLPIIALRMLKWL